jgi:paraquat-inducible protein B
MAETTIDMSAIIDEVARRHKIRLADDDPILATVTVTDIVHKLFANHLERLVEHVANQATDRLAAQIETGRRELAAQTEAAKDASSKLINDAGVWSAENLKQASAASKDDIKAAVSAAMSTVQTDIQAVRKAKAVAVWAALTAVTLGGALLGGGFGFWLAGNWSAFQIRG